jgi:hypothetical protein
MRHSICCCREENAVGMVDFYGTEEHVIRFLTRPEQNVCTDGLLGGKPHPRVFGSFPRVLGKYVREEKALTLEDAIRKMTSKPAEVFGFERVVSSLKDGQLCRHRCLQSSRKTRSSTRERLSIRSSFPRAFGKACEAGLSIAVSPRVPAGNPITRFRAMKRSHVDIGLIAEPALDPSAEKLATP